MNSTLRTICFAVFLLLASAPLSAQISSDFASNADGWTTPNDQDGTITYNATGGNPTGHVSGSPFFINVGAGTIYLYFYFIAPGKFLGNRNAYYGGTLRYQIQPSSTGAAAQYAEVILRNNAGIALYYFPTIPHQPPAAPTWTTFSVTLNDASGFWKTTDSPTGPAATEAQIRSVLVDLASLEIRGLYRDANTTNRLDNVTLMPPIVITAQPSAATLCVGGTATFSTAATGNPNITYQWQRQTAPTSWTNVTNTGGYTGATTNTLSVNTTGNFGAGTYRCLISGTAVDDQITSAATLVINPLPSPPSVTGSSSCSASALTLSANGGAAGQYRWYTVATGGTPIAGQTNSTYTTPVLSVSTTYYVAINNGCQSTRTAVVATINTPPAAPSATGTSLCSGSNAVLAASGGSAGQYRWYTVASGGTPIAGQTNSTYSTPVLSATTTYYVAIHNGTCESARTAIVTTVNAIPAAPLATGVSVCAGASAALVASGGSPGRYRWYSVPTGGTAISGQTGDTYNTPALSATTTFYVAVNLSSCESSRTAVTATVNALPSAPSVVDAFSCEAGALILTASGASAGQYRWYTSSSGGTPLAGETSDTYNTPLLSATTPYYVSINDGTCESLRTPVVASIAPPVCSNHAPAIEAAPLSTQINGTITISLEDLVSDSDDNLDLSSLTIVSPPTSGATATIDANFNLTIDYNGIAFSGTEHIALQVCDVFSACTEQIFSIEVVGEIVVYNGISPNNDDRNAVFLLEHIEKMADTRENKVTIFNRWGDVVWEGTNYNNTTIVFTGKSKNDQELPSGTYFYKVEFFQGRPQLLGYLSLKR